MPDDLEVFMMNQSPTAERPLLGLTVLIVEDSRFACEAMRLLCLRSGARIRRADSLASARRHLRVYRPSVVIVDLGLPDGSGTELIEELSVAQPRVDVLLAISGDTGAAQMASDAGADGFLAKPIASLAEFQEAVLTQLPDEARPEGFRLVSDEEIHPDPIALQDDLAHAADMISHATEDDMTGYLAQFLAGVAKSAGDVPLREAAEQLGCHRRDGQPTSDDLSRISGLVNERLDGRMVV
jgi:DNA-binding response OmpR family regulator